jgi:hypothetical protein
VIAVSATEQSPAARRVRRRRRYHRPVADELSSQPLEQQLQEIGAQLAWVRDYL